MMLVAAVVLGLAAFVYKMFQEWKPYIADWVELRQLLSQYPADQTKNLRERMHFYDLSLEFVTSYVGLFYVIRMSLVAKLKEVLTWQSQLKGSTENNHDMTMYYFKPYVATDPDCSNPTKWSYQGLSTTPWLDWKRSFSPQVVKDLQALIDNIDVISAEFNGKVSEAMTPHPDQQTEVEKGGAWDWRYMYGVGGKNEAVCASCPKTTALIERLPLCENFGFVFFSRLKPGTHIMKHTGSTNLRHRVHLGIDVPEDTVQLRCGTEWRPWEDKGNIVFDDSFEHEVLHKGKKHRAVLIIDLWPGQLTKAEVRILNEKVMGRFGRRPKKNKNRNLKEMD